MFTFGTEARAWLLAERNVPQCPAHQARAVAELLSAARIRLQPARDVWSAPRPVLAAALLREGVAILAFAAAAARDQPVDERTVATTLTALRAARPPGVGDDDVRRVDAAVATDDPLYFDSLDDAELRATIRALQSEVSWLESRVDLRSDAYVMGTRVGRIAAVLVVVALLLEWSFAKAFTPRNLALGKHVTASSHQGGTPDPSGLTDGLIADSYGFHTDVSRSDAWGIVDLGAEHHVRKVVVFNRSDRNLDDGLPLSLDTSLDGKDFHEVAQRTTSFGDGTFLAPPWTAKIQARARYVRVRSPHYLALNELQVF
jgi:hypothetical protein